MTYDPVDANDDGVVESDVDNESVNTEETDSAINANNFDSLQAAEEAVPEDSNAFSLKKLIIPGREGGYQETVDIGGIGKHVELTGGTEPHIEGSGDHTVRFASQDGHMVGGWIDQTDTGEAYDAVHIPDGITEVVIIDQDVDYASRYGYRVGGNRCEIGPGVQILGGETAGLFVATGAREGKFEAQVNGRFAGDIGKGAVINSEKNRLDLLINDVNGDGLTISGNVNIGSAEVGAAGGDGIIISGIGNTLKVNVYSATGDEVVISGDGNVLNGRVDGDVTIESGASDNDLTGCSISGTVNDNSGNSTNGY